jgi:ATP-dependent DNA ligase
MRFLFPSKPNRISIDSTIFESCDKDPNFILQIKKNGWRVQIHKEGSEVQFFTRHNKRLEPLVEDADWTTLRNTILKIKANSIILDGEFLHRRGSLKNHLYVWDVFLHNNQLLSNQSYKQRKELLNSLIVNDQYIQVAQDFISSFRSIWDQLTNIEEDEGVVLKDLREKLIVRYVKPSDDKSPRQFKILLEDKRNYIGKDK